MDLLVPQSTEQERNQMNDEIKQFSFDGAEFPVIQTDRLHSGEAITTATVCDHLGIDSRAQQRAIERKSWSEGRAAMMAAHLPGTDRSRQYFVLDTSRFAMWMATIDTNRIQNEDAKQRIIKWQNEAADALDTYLREDVVVRPSSTKSNEEILAAVERQLEIRMYKSTIRDIINSVDDHRKSDYGRFRNEIYRWLTGMDAEEIRTSGRAIQQWKGKNGPTKTDLGNASNYLTVDERKRENALLKVTDGIQEAHEIRSIHDLELVLDRASKVLDGLQEIR
jgi:hypothetical protein